MATPPAPKTATAARPPAKSETRETLRFLLILALVVLAIAALIKYLRK